MLVPEHFKRVVVEDFEFIPDVPHYRPVCGVFHELRNGETMRLWGDQLGDKPPYSMGPDSLIVGYNLEAELKVHRALGWPMPACCADLYFEFRHRTSGLSGWPPKRSRKLLDAAAFYGLPCIDAVEKQEMRDRILKGPPYSKEERQAIISYCDSDVRLECRLLQVMAPDFRWPYVVYRGRDAAALALTDLIGTPLDRGLLERFQLNRETILDRLIAEIDKDYGVFDGRTFKQDWFAQYLSRVNIPWPATASGQLNLDDDTFEDMSETYPQLKPLRHLRQNLAGLRKGEIAIDKDGRNRGFLNPFGSSTGRNQPRECIWLMPAWLRGLVKPPEGYALVHLDYGGQEIGCAGSLSRDQNMMDAYKSEDAYLWFAKKGELVPPEATRRTHNAERSLYKIAFLGINYGIGPESLGLRINRSELFARHLIGLHHELFPDYWRWSNRAVDHAMLFGWQSTMFDWIYRLAPNPRPTALRNFPIQSSGAEMLRLGHCLATERGIQVCCPIHDAYVIQTPLEILDQEIVRMRSCMAEASRVVLRGFELFTDVKVIRYPDRYRSSKGEAMWNLVTRLLEEIETETEFQTALPVNTSTMPVSVKKNPTLNLSNTRWACAINWPTKKLAEPSGH